MAEHRINPAAVEESLAGLTDPETGRELLAAGQIQDIAADSQGVMLTLSLSTHSAPLREDVRQEAEEMIRARFPGLEQVTIHVETLERPPQKLGQIGLSAKSVIAVGSGKGGVGKSTIAASIAYGLQRAGCKVGLVDADVYGPSIPHLLGLSGRASAEDNRLQPMVRDGIEVMSIGFLIPPDQPVVWRGPMLHQAITNFLRDTNWSGPDYLIIDMPPGTGDIALTLSQLLPLTGAVVVCTPQDVALLDAVKAINMFRTVKIPVLGMVENMSGFICSECGTVHDIFGSGGAEKRANELGVPFLGKVPLDLQVRLNGDAGQTGQNFDSPATREHLAAICHNLARKLAESARENPPKPSLPVL